MAGLAASEALHQGLVELGLLLVLKLVVLHVKSVAKLVNGLVREFPGSANKNSVDKVEEGVGFENFKIWGVLLLRPSRFSLIVQNVSTVTRKGFPELPVSNILDKSEICWANL